MPELDFKTINLRLKKSFALSKASASEKKTLIARYGSGVGEGSPSILYGTSAEDVRSQLQALLATRGTQISDDQMCKFLHTLPESLDTGICALEMAFLDHQARALGIPLYQHLSLSKPVNINSSLTITPGSADELKAQMELARPFSGLKLKVGFARDIEFVNEVLRHQECRLRLDANGGWSTDETIEKIKALSGYPIEFIEQPITDPSPRDLDKIKTKVESTIFLDESTKSVEDLIKYASVIDGVNLKLTKCGGMTRTLAMAMKAQQLKLKLLLGCMIETTIGITAALHIASLFDYFDLDSILLTENDPYWGAHFDGDKLVLPGGAGLGIVIEENTLV